MSTIKRHKSAKLIPSCLHFAPFFQVRILHARFFILSLGCFVTFFHTESTDIHAPERPATHREVQSSGHLCPHIFPSGTDVTAPSSSAVPLQSCESTASEQENTCVGINAALPVIDGFSILKCISIKILIAWTKSSRSTEFLSIVNGCTVTYIRFAGIHPPGIHTFIILAVQIVIHLPPEHLTCPCRIGIIERPQITWINPVAYTVFDSLLVHPSMAVQLLIIFCCQIEFRPYRNHKSSVHSVHTVKHSLRIRIAGGIKQMTTPGINGPITPILHNVVYRNMALAKLSQCPRYLVLRFVSFPTLPESHRPLRHNGSFACQCAIAADDIIHTVTRNKVIVHIWCHLAPHR